MNGHDHEETATLASLDEQARGVLQGEERGPGAGDGVVPARMRQSVEVGAGRRHRSDDDGVGAVVPCSLERLGDGACKIGREPVNGDAHQYFPTTKPPSTRRYSPVT